MANTATLGILRLLLTANSVELKTELEKARRTVDNFAKDLRGIGTQAQNVGRTLTAGLTLPIVGVAAASAKAAIGFETAFANVAKTVDGVSDKFGKLTPAGAALAQTFRQMAKEIPVTTDELTAIAALGGQMGVPIAQLASFTKNVAALGVAVDGISTEEAAAGLAAIGNATGTGTTKIAEMASALVHLGNNSNATEGQILDFTKRLIGAGNAAGFTVPDVMALGTAMANVGINAEAGGTAMSQVIAKISKAVSTGSKDLDDFAKVAGRTAEEFAALWKKSPIEAMDLFIKGLGTMKARGVDLNLTMGELGTEGIRVADTLKRLAGATQSVATVSKLANDGYAAANKHLEEAEKKYATTERQLTLLWNRIKDVGITIGNALLPGINAGIKLLETFIPLVDSLAKMFAALPGSVQLVGLALLGLVAAAGPALIIFGQLARSAADIIALFGKKGLATRLLAGDFGTLTGASTKLTGALGLLSKASLVAGAALGGWAIGRLISQLFDLDAKIADTTVGIENLTRARQLTAQGKPDAAAAEVKTKLVELERKEAEAIRDHNLAAMAMYRTQIDSLKNDQTRLAIQDAINKAIRDGADKTITYAEAVKFNETNLKNAAASQDFWNKAQAEGTAATTTATKSVSLLAELNARYAADLKKIGTSGFKEILTAHEQFSVSVKDLSEKYGVAESSIERFIDAQKGVSKALKDADAPLATFTKNAKQLETQLAAAEAAGVPMVLVLEEFGSAIEDVTHKAPLFEQMARNAGKSFDGIGEATKRAAAELRKGEIEKASAKMFEQLNDQARQMVGEWQKAGDEAAAKFRGAFERQSKEFLTAANQVQTALVAGEEDSLEKRQTLVKLEYEAKRLALDQFDTFHDLKLQQINLDEQKAADAATLAWQEHIEAVRREVNSYPNIFAAALKNIPGLIQQALTGGGGLSGGIQAALSGLGGGLGTRLFGDLAAKASSSLFKMFGTGITSALGTLIPGIGGALGSLLGTLAPKIGGFFKKLFGGGDDGDKERDAFFKSVEGGFDGVAAKLHTLGAEGDKLFNQLLSANSGKKAAAAIEQIKAALEKAAAKDAEFNAGLQTTLTRIRDLGGKLPDALKSYLDGLAKAGRLTKENLDLLAQLSGSGVADWRKVEEAVGRYGGSIEKLGGTFQAARLHDAWQQIIDDTELFTNAGISAEDQLELIKGKVIELVQQSMKFGTEIPDNMKPWIEKLILSGELVDENGNKIEDISKLHFGATLQSTLEKLNVTLELLLKNLGLIKPTIEATPKSIDIDVNYRQRTTGEPPPEMTDRGEYAAFKAPTPEQAEAYPNARFGEGGRVSPITPRYFDAGTGGISRALAMWIPKGLDKIPAMLRPGEVVSTPDDWSSTLRAFSQVSAMGYASLERAERSIAHALGEKAVDRSLTIGPWNFYIPPGEFHRALRDGAPITVQAINDNHLGTKSQLEGRSRVLGGF